MYYIPKFVKQVSDLEYGSVVTHENYNEKLNLNMDQGDYNTEVLNILFNERDINKAYRVPYLEKYADDAVSKIQNNIKEHVDQIDTNTKNIKANQNAIASNTNTITGILEGTVAVKKAILAAQIEGIDKAANRTYYGKDFAGAIGFHEVPDGIFAEDIGSDAAEISGIYYVPRSDSVEEHMLSYAVRTKLNRTAIVSYDELTNKPQINNVDLTGNLSLSDLGIQPAGSYLTAVPEGYLTSDEIAGQYLSKEEATSQYTPIWSFAELQDDVNNLITGVADLNYNRVCIGEFTGEPKTGDLLIDL